MTKKEEKQLNKVASLINNTFNLPKLMQVGLCDLDQNCLDYYDIDLKLCVLKENYFDSLLFTLNVETDININRIVVHNFNFLFFCSNKTERQKLAESSDFITKSELPFRKAYLRSVEFAKFNIFESDFVLCQNRKTDCINEIIIRNYHFLKSDFKDWLNWYNDSENVLHENIYQRFF